VIVVDEVGYIPFDPEAANQMFSLVSSRYERASMIVTSAGRAGAGRALRWMLAGGDPVARPVPKLLRLVARAARELGLPAPIAFAASWRRAPRAEFTERDASPSS
jgi:IstB-like ATP binding protein